MTSTTPKNLIDLRYQDNVITLKNGEAPESSANRFFHELFDPTAAVKVNFLFTEEGKKVYEAYQDSGSVDYLYLIA